jgi:hypothetical protein
MPSCSGGFDGTVSFTSGLKKRIKTPSTLAFQKSSPRSLIHDQKEVWMKLKKGIVISAKAMYRDKIFLALGT